MALASITRVRSRAVAVLLANSAGYIDVVDGSAGRYLSTQEFTDVALQKDAELCIAALETANHWHRASFTPVQSLLLANGDKLPVLQGAVDSIIYALSDSNPLNYKPSKLAASKDEVLSYLEFGANVYGSSVQDVAGFHFIEDNRLYHSSPYARVNYFTFTIGTALQSPDIWEDAIAQGVVSTMNKDGSATEAIHQLAEQKFQNKLNEIRSFPRVFPEAQAAEMSR